MARRASTTEKVRLNLNLSKRVNDRLEELRDETDADSITEVIRRSIAVYDHLLSEHKDNKAEIVLRLANGEERQLVLT